MTRHRRSASVPCDKCLQDGRAKERADIVAWLRTSTPERGADSVALRIVTETLLLADQIEDGEHER